MTHHTMLAEPVGRGDPLVRADSRDNKEGRPFRWTTATPILQRRHSFVGQRYSWLRSNLLKIGELAIHLRCDPEICVFHKLCILSGFR